MNLDDRFKEEKRREELRIKLIFGGAILLIDITFFLGLYYYYNRFISNKSGIISVIAIGVCLLIFNKRILLDFVLKKHWIKTLFKKDFCF